MFRAFLLGCRRKLNPLLNRPSSLPDGDHIALGALGEKIARAYLKAEGRRVLYRNFQAPRGGEIDIVTRDGTTLAFVEVNTRSSERFARPLEAVNTRKKQLMQRGANEWLRLLGTRAIAFGLAASSIFPVLMMGIFSKKMNRQGAIAGMIAGMSITLLYVFQHKGILFIPGTSFLGGMEANWFLGITPNAFGAVGALVNFAVAFAVSKTAAEAPQEVQDLVENIRVPSKD